MTRLSLIVVSFLMLSVSCKSTKITPIPAPSTTSDKSSKFGNGDEILKEVFNSSLVGYDLKYGDISWSGSSSVGLFSHSDKLLVLDADSKIIADRIQKQLGLMADKRGWTTHGKGRTDNRFLRIHFEEDNAHFFMDFILTQDGKNVEVYILYKGVQL